MPEKNIVLVDDEKHVLDLQQESLRTAGLQSSTFNEPMQAWNHIQSNDIAVVVTDWNMPGMTGMELFFKTRALPHPPVVVIVTAYGTVDRAVQAISEGAFYFLEKPFNIDRFTKVVKDALTKYERSLVPRSKPAPQRASAPGDPVYRSSAMISTIDIARSAAAMDSSILLLGETGSGKEVLADFIHQHSNRAKGPLVKVNCGALPEHLMESELFGHEKGAFTGAQQRMIGRFEQANGGTLFLDEIGDLLLPLQVKLLRALQDRRIERVGSTTSIPVDFRLVCATHQNLRAAVAEKRFREDLFYRINVVPIHVPPLRERVDDIEPLALHFLNILNSRLPNPKNIDNDSLACMRAYPWPGNVRQLRSAIEHALVLSKGSTITPGDLPMEFRTSTAAAEIRSEPAVSAPVAIRDAGTTGLKDSVQEAESRHIRAALEKHNWRVTEVAKELGISRSSLYERMKLYGIKRPGS